MAAPRRPDLPALFTHPVLAVLLVACITAAVLAAQAPPPAEPADRFVTVNGLQLHYVDWGNPAAPPMVLVHGLDRVARTFDHVAAHYRSRYHVVALDMRGHGDSDWDPQGRYVVEDHLGDLEGLVRELGLRGLTLWGNSTGGRVVQVFAGAHPELVAAVISEDVGPERPRSIADAYARRVAADANGWATEDELYARLKAQSPTTTEAVLRPYVRYATKRRDDGRLVWRRDPNLVKGFVETDLWRFVGRITAPTLYVLGGRSNIVPAETQQLLQARLPRVQLVVMPGLGHFPSDEQPDAFMAIVDRFLAAPPVR